jgi:glycosyltransferase involved in cell wall biosynthesis
VTVRVVVVTTYFRPIMGGVETTAERFALYLRSKQVDVQILTKRITPDLPDRDLVQGLRINRIGPSGERSAAGKWRLVPAAAEWLVANRQAYDVVCCIDYRGIGLAALAARALTGKPAVFQAQTTGILSGEAARTMMEGLGGGSQLLGLFQPAVVALYRRADALACISHGIEREALSAGVPRERVHYVPNAVDMSRFRPADPGERLTLREGLAIPSRWTACLYVGRLSREKGLMDLVEAWRLANLPNAVLLVAGPDMVDHPWNVGPTARRFVEEHGLGATVRFLGPISDVAPLLRAADLVSQPSHFEALGLSAIEALASGVPVVASAVGGLVEFITDGQNGKLHPPESPRELAACLELLVKDEPLRQRLAKKARASVEAEYDEQVIFARFADLLRRTAEARA